MNALQPTKIQLRNLEGGVPTYELIKLKKQTNK